MRALAETETGSKCHICMGCGRCWGEREKYHVLTHEIWSENGEAIISPKGERLVTVDVGTTTIAMLLYHRDGKIADEFMAVNPQISFGADVLSRIRAAESSQALSAMQEQVQGVLRQGVEAFRRQIEQGESLRMVLAANTTMVYLLMGWNPKELGEAPFFASRLAGVHTTIAGVPCYILPGQSAFVGGDITAGILACGMLETEEITLLIDLGTNGELVLGNKKKMISCSTAAGPAFEGGVNRGIWGADMVNILAGLRNKNLVDETGLLADPYFDQGIRVGNVCVTQEAVRALQLAKAAVAAGIRILVQEYGIAFAQISRVILSGGFGYYLRPEDGARIGLFPQELVGRTMPGGNTALGGALQVGRWLFSGMEESTLEKKMELLQIKNINLAENPCFSQYYIEAINL